MNQYEHIPVLLNEVVFYLKPEPGQNFFDGTLGGGGYTRALLEKTAPDGKVLAVDLDSDAIENFRARHSSLTTRCALVHGNFKDIDHIIKNHDFPAPDGITADLGLSSYELDQAGRGISFQKKEPLDMRFDQSQEREDAKFILNSWTEKELRHIFDAYGEEKFAGRIAQNIVKARTEKQIKYTTDLYEVIEQSLPKPVRHKAQDSARRIFQALRIAVNHELENLETFLPKAFDILAPGGRMAIVAFHSLEDRIVKQFFVGLSKGCVCPVDFPQCLCGRNPQAKILTKKPVTAGSEELEKNPRSKPAKLRAIMKI